MNALNEETYRVSQNPDDLSDVDPASLANLIWDPSELESLWSAAELKAILEHQLDADILYDLGQYGELAGFDLRELMNSVTGPPICSFRDLFQHPSPSIELLDLTRRFAKSCRSRRDSPLPVETGTVLYLSSIAVAKIRCDHSITTLDDRALSYGFAWALDQDWLEESTRQLLEGGIRNLQSSGPTNDG